VSFSSLDQVAGKLTRAAATVKAMAADQMLNRDDAIQGSKNGGSGGARTRQNSNNEAAFVLTPSQTASQEPVALGHDLSRVVTIWSKLSTPLKAAILAIVNSAEDQP
jgi:hypothetical protein